MVSLYSVLRLTVGLIMFISNFGVMCHASVEISQGVVFQRNGALDIICRTNDTSAYDVMFVLRHNGIIIRNSKSNIRWPGADWLYYKFHVENATQKDAGEYECNIQQEKGTVVSMTATMVEVNDGIIVGKMGGTVRMQLLRDGQTEILCYTADEDHNHVEDCVQDIVVTDAAISKRHEFVIASQKAIQEYETVSNAIGNKTTFNFSKTVIGLEINKETDENGRGRFIMKLKGNRSITEHMNISCSGATTIRLSNLSQGAAYTGVNEMYPTYECEKAGSDVIAEVYWRGKLLGRFLWSEDSSGAANGKLPCQHLWWILSVLQVLLYMYKMEYEFF